MTTKPSREKGTSTLGLKCYPNLHADGDQASKTNTLGFGQGTKTLPLSW